MFVDSDYFTFDGHNTDEYRICSDASHRLSSWISAIIHRSTNGIAFCHQVWGSTHWHISTSRRIFSRRPETTSWFRPIGCSMVFHFRHFQPMLVINNARAMTPIRWRFTMCRTKMPVGTRWMQRTLGAKRRVRLNYSFHQLSIPRVSAECWLNNTNLLAHRSHDRVVQMIIFISIEHIRQYSHVHRVVLMHIISLVKDDRVEWEWLDDAPTIAVH